MKSLSTLTSVVGFILFVSFHSQDVYAQTWLHFEKKDFKIKYPSTWTIDTSKKFESELAIKSPRENENDEFFENVTLTVQHLDSQNFDLDSLMMTEEQIKQLGNDVKLFETKRVKTGNSKYYKIIYSATMETYKLKFEMRYFIKGNKLFVLAFATELERSETFRIIGEQILNSFTLTK